MLQEFISSACIEHLDFLTVRNADRMIFHPFVEMDMLTKFRSLTSIAAPASTDNELENWVDLKVYQPIASIKLSSTDLAQHKSQITIYIYIYIYTHTFSYECNLIIPICRKTRINMCTMFEGGKHKSYYGKSIKFLFFFFFSSHQNDN